MDSQEFREFGKILVDYIADYMDNIRDRPVLPSVKPGYLQAVLPENAPEEPENWKDLLNDFTNHIMPGVTHWHSPQFHAYYPTGQSYPSIAGDMLSNGLGVIGFSWISSPACTELEVITLNWLGRLLGLPEHFLNSSDGPGGGVIQGSASEATLVGLLAAKERMVRKLRVTNPELDENTIKGKLVAYTSNQSNSSVEKAGLLASVPMKMLPVDENCRLRADTFKRAIEEDRANGLIPCYLVATLGTTGTCAFDPLEELGAVCNAEGVWLHVDAAYAGPALMCPEYRHLMAGVELVDSFNFNAHKWMLVNFDCSPMWVKDHYDLVNAFDVQRIYLADNHSNDVPDYRHWQLPLGRRFRSLKLWSVLRLYGAEGIRKHIRNHISLASYFGKLVQADKRFELVLEPVMGVVCFRLKGEDSLTKKLLEILTERKNIYMVAATYHGQYIIRFVVCSRLCETRDVEFAWSEIQTVAKTLVSLGVEQKVPLEFPALQSIGNSLVIEEKSK